MRTQKLNENESMPNMLAKCRMLEQKSQEAHKERNPKEAGEHAQNSLGGSAYQLQKRSTQRDNPPKRCNQNCGFGCESLRVAIPAKDMETTNQLLRWKTILALDSRGVCLVHSLESREL